MKHLPLYAVQICTIAFIMGFAQSDDLEREALRNIPNRDYNIFFSIKPAEIFRSPLIQGYLNELHPDERILAVKTLKSRFEISPVEFDIGVFFSYQDKKNPWEWCYYARGPFTPTIVKALEEKLNHVKSTEIQEAVAMGKTYWKFTSTWGNEAFTTTGDGFIGGTEECVLDAMAMAGKAGADITRDEAFTRAYQLVDVDATSKFLLWNLSSPSNSIGYLIRLGASSSGDEKFVDAQLYLETIGAFARFGSDINITIRILYNKPDSALHTVAYFEQELTKQRKDMTNQDDIRIANSIKISLSGSIIEIHATIPGDYQPFNSLVRNFIGVIRTPQQITSEHIQKLGQCVEEYIMDQYDIGAPKTDKLEELYKIFHELDYIEDESLCRDAWDNLLIYEYEPVLGSKNYTITSYGTDGKPGPETATPGVVTRFVEDILWARGAFVQRPAGKLYRY